MVCPVFAESLPLPLALRPCPLLPRAARRRRHRLREYPLYREHILYSDLRESLENTFCTVNVVEGLLIQKTHRRAAWQS